MEVSNTKIDVTRGGRKGHRLGGGGKSEGRNREIERSNILVAARSHFKLPTYPSTPQPTNPTTTAIIPPPSIHQPLQAIHPLTSLPRPVQSSVSSIRLLLNTSRRDSLWGRRQEAAIGSQQHDTYKRARQKTLCQIEVHVQEAAGREPWNRQHSTPPRLPRSH